ncbi:lysine--tRNA ligase [Saccharothrix australiensis]|uniref:Lysine--tRNA ligase n=1 Tax=Saccharothrix australiensis TaxID=2072 RepID=A0A495VZ61_9PSEU|nr:lysine--tRNA ligase [Saccharothrix australiensis]RKT53813.1 lysyl-tRNA synthetase class I [Saccharothrix australiensis]
MSTKDGQDWVARKTDEVVAEADRRAPDKPVVCASGISPSGPIHLGNLREIMVPHLVADELHRRGRDRVHILSWDDYDRLRKVPAGVPPEFAEHIGRPLSAVPDPWGEYESWAERFKAPFRAALARLGVELREISQTEMYRSGAYADQVLRAMDARERIDALLSRYRTKGAEGGPSEEDYYPYRPYCHDCGRDETVVTGYDSAAATVDYRCRACGHTGTVRLREANSGKLVWKVDWPMRWAYEGVVFEGAGADHSSPGSSFTVGSAVVREVFGAEPPVYQAYSFVGIKGATKMSGSKGAVPTATDGLRVLEAPTLRWLYSRRKPEQAFSVDFGAEVVRLYDEWDRLNANVAAGKADAWEVSVLDRATVTSLGPLPRPARTVSFRLLAAAQDITAGDPVQLARILRDVDPELTPSAVEPRLSLAANWLAEHVAPEERTRVRAEPATADLAALTGEQRESLRLLHEHMDDDWSLDGLTRLVYGIPKLRAGLALEDKPTPEVAQAQKDFFRLMYHLLVDAERGPRLPTLLLSIGADRIRQLLPLD